MDLLPRLTAEEVTQRERLEERYRWAFAPVMMEIERSVCGCDYGGSSWTTRSEADAIAGRLGLHDTSHLLDLGAGSGWPGLYFCQTTGCRATLVDLPVGGLKLARDRARTDKLSEAVSVAVGDAANLPFPDDSFDALSHSDLLCCLIQKRSVLGECRRVVRRNGRMAFTVISVPTDLAPELYREGVASGPEFVETDREYAPLLVETKWDIADIQDITRAYAASCRRQLEADQKHESDLCTLLGNDVFVERIDSWRTKLSAIERGLLRRQLFVATPA